MTQNDLCHANNLREKILQTERFISDLRCNSNIRMFDRVIKKKDRDNLGVVISDYIRPYKYYELNRDQRDRLIKLLEEDLREYKSEFENM